jgi:hypothetical protein
MSTIITLSTLLDPSSLPDLPPITDEDLETLALTHKAKQAIKGINQNYDKLAHVGDAILGEFIYRWRSRLISFVSASVVTSLLHDLYPDLKKGPATVSSVSHK